MEISVSQPARFKKIFDVLKELYVDLEVEFTDLGFGFLLADKSGSAFVHLTVRNTPTNFPIYTCPEPVKVCLSMEPFCKLMHPLNNDYTLNLNIKPEQAKQPTELFVRMQDESQALQPSYKGSIRLSSSTEEQRQLEGFTFDRTARIESQKLKGYCNDLSWINNDIMVTIKATEIELRCKGELADVAVQIPCILMPEKNRVVLDNAEPEPLALPPTESDISTTNVQTEGDVRGIFSLKYMKNFLKAQDLAREVQVSLSNDGPLLLRFEMTDYGVLEFFLAPIAIEQSPFSDMEGATAMDITQLV